LGYGFGLAFGQDNLASKVSAAAFDLGLLVETAGPRDEVVKLFAPLTITDSELDHGLELLAKAVRAVTENLRPAPIYSGADPRG
jgi:diaminobutyrate-2-oxoglutarate transaminase